MSYLIQHGRHRNLTLKNYLNPLAQILTVYAIPCTIYAAFIDLSIYATFMITSCTHPLHMVNLQDGALSLYFLASVLSAVAHKPSGPYKI